MTQLCSLCNYNKAEYRIQANNFNGAICWWCYNCKPVKGVIYNTTEYFKGVYQ